MRDTSASGPAFSGENPAPKAPSARELVGSVGRFLRRRYKLILLCALIAIPLASAYITIVPKQYTASASLLIETRRGQFSPERTVLGDIPLDSLWIETQLSILLSERVLASVAKDLQIKDTSALDTFPTHLANSLRDRAFSILPLERLRPRTTPEANEERVIKALQRQVQVKRNGVTWIIDVIARSADPELAAEIANAVADAYIREQRESKLEAARLANEWLEARLSVLREQSAAAENAVVSFRAKNDIVAIGGKLVSEQQVGELNSQIATMRAEAAGAKARLTRIEDVLRSTELGTGAVATVAESLSSSIITRLRTQYIELANREAEYSARYGPEHLAVISLRSQLRALRGSMRDELARIAETYRNDHAIAQQRLSDMEERVSTYAKKLQDANAAEVTLRQLEVKAKSYGALHDVFLQRHSEAQQALMPDEARVISRASAPFSTRQPKPIAVASVALLCCMGAGIGFGLLRDLLDKTFRSVSQLQDAVRVECLAVVPTIRAPRRSLLQPFGSRARLEGLIAPAQVPLNRSRQARRTSMPLLVFAEAIRSIRLGLAFAKREHGVRVVGVTSIEPGEGKSTVIAAVARAVAETGARTILVDGDLRKRTLSRRLVMDASVGLLEVIRGSSSLEAAIWTEPDSRLAFLPNVCPNPAAAELDAFGRRDSEALFERLRAQYDYVFLDLPSMGPLTDVRSTTNICDGYLMVVAWGKTEVDATIAALSSAPRVWGKLIGTVLNRADLSQMDHYDPSSRIKFDREYMRSYGQLEARPLGRLVAADNGLSQPAERQPVAGAA